MSHFRLHINVIVKSDCDHTERLVVLPSFFYSFLVAQGLHINFSQETMLHEKAVPVAENEAYLPFGSQIYGILSRKH
jgi:hypothetical protein